MHWAEQHAQGRGGQREGAGAPTAGAGLRFGPERRKARDPVSAVRVERGDAHGDALSARGAVPLLLLDAPQAHVPAAARRGQQPMLQRGEGLDRRGVRGDVGNTPAADRLPETELAVGQPAGDQSL